MVVCVQNLVVSVCDGDAARVNGLVLYVTYWTNNGYHAIGDILAVVSWRTEKHIHDLCKTKQKVYFSNLFSRNLFHGRAR